MPTIFTHSVVPIAIGFGLGRNIIPPRLIAAGIVASVVPDLDVLAFRLDVAYSHDLGHRGASHSLAFAAVLGFIAALAAPFLRAKRLNAFLFVTISAASHGLLDMLTNGGLGVALLWPYASERMFFPWRPIVVSPLSLWEFLGLRGWRVVASEMLWVWLPSAILFILIAVMTAGRRPRSST
ncbi:MAG TPA: metal-dependent hydrolase [Pyrinomonadaceae bacterium]|nr:metal-dependent hydrolase [Pyrinomonadaceae bacterium]HMP64273.1 metal-dependent hydrolase [Pyrinomonadaceae bacterium]